MTKPGPDPFAYASDPEAVGVKRSHVAFVPAGIDSRDALFACLTRELRLPDYFGRNWDALNDCLKDLSWIDGQRLVLFHEGLPKLEDGPLATYLEILRDAVLDWREDPDDELIVVFPAADRGRLAALLPADD